MVNHSTMPDPVEANYAVWNADSTIELHTVPWDNDYRNVVEWASDASRENWFNSRMDNQKVRFMGASYARIDQPIRLEIPFNTAYQYNYIRVQNKAQSPVGNGPSTYYYFIIGLEQRAPGTVWVTVQLDVWTTFRSQAKFGTCYVERGHLGIANQNNFSNFGRDFLAIPEGLDVGPEYQTVYHVNHDIMHVANGKAFIGNSYSIMIATTVNVEVSGGTIANPSLSTARGDNVQGLPSGTTYYVFQRIEDFQNFMAYVSDKPWVSQGIISITAVPNVTKYGYTLRQVNPPGFTGLIYRLNAQYGKGAPHFMLANWRDNENLLNAIPARYRKLRKFFTAPYMMLELTTFAGNPVVMRPESWNDPHGWVSEHAVLSAPNQRVVFKPVKYNAGRGSTIVDQDTNGGALEDNGEYWDVHTQVSNLPTFALVNSGYLAFMASNAHGIQQQYNSADWSQQKAMYGASVSYDQANNSIQTGAANATTARNAAIGQVGVQNDFATAQGIVSGAASAVNGATAGALGGGPGAVGGAAVGALSSAAGNMLNQMQRNASLGVSNDAAVQTQRQTQGNQQYLADTNKALAQWAATGDYQNSIAAINARVQDARLTQPSVSGQQGGETFNMVHGGIVLSLRFKMLSYNAMCAIGDYWLRYGYAVQRFIQVDTLVVMSKFSYWKMQEANLIDTRLPEFIKQAIRGIVEKGVTVFTSPDYIGKVDISDNAPVPGIVIPVDSQSDPTPEPPVDLIPFDDEDDEMYTAHLNTPRSLYWAFSKGYLNLMNQSGTGTAIPALLIGKNPIEMSTDDFARALRFCGIPDRYTDPDLFMTENPDATWRAEETADAAIAQLAQNVADNYTSVNSTLNAILAKLDDPDNPQAG